MLCCVYADGRSPEIVLSYMEHGSLAYGADWCRGSVDELPELPANYNLDCYDTLPDSDGPNSKKLADEPFSTFGRMMHSRSLFPVGRNDELIASCSFYDHQLRIWAALGSTSV